MATYYVSPTGNDNSSAATSPTTPWRTINYAVTQLSAGDTLRLMDGTFTLTSPIRINENGTSGSRITIEANSGATPIIDGGWRDDGTLPNYTTGLISGSVPSFAQHDAMVVIGGDYITVNGIVLRGSPAFSMAITGANVDITNCVIYGGFSGGLKIFETTNILVEDTEIFYTSLRELPRYSNKVTPDGLRIVDHPPPISTAGTRYVTIRRCNIHDNGGEGIDLYAGGNILVEDCYSYNNTRTQLYVDWAGEGSVVRNNIIFCSDNHNTAVGKVEPGITLRDERTGSGAYKRNCCGNTTGIQIYNNLVVNARDGLEWTTLASLTNAYIAHNTFVNCANGVTMYGDVSRADPPGVRSWSGCVVENNVWVGESKNTLTTNTGPTWRNNVWSKTPGSNGLGSNSIVSNASLVNKNASITTSLPDTSATTHGKYTGFANSHDFDPANYHLSSSSPAISAARSSGKVATDYRGATRDASPDCGFMEYSGEVTPVMSAGFTLSASSISPGDTVTITSTASMTSGAIDTWAYHWTLDGATWTSIGTSEDETFTPSVSGSYIIRQTVTDTETAATKYYSDTLTVTAEDSGGVVSAGNLITNGDFASGTTGWSISKVAGSWSVVDGRAKIINAEAFYLYRSNFEMLDGVQYTVAMDLELTGGGTDPDRPVEIQIIQDGSPNANVIERFSVTVPNNGSYQINSVVDQILGADESDCRLRIKINYINSGQALYIDNVVVAPYVEVVAGFSTSDTTPDLDDVVTFTDSSTNASSWLWEIEDGDGEYVTFSTVQNPTYTFIDSGVYTVRQTVTNADTGSSDTATESITVDEDMDYYQTRLRPGMRKGLP